MHRTHIQKQEKKTVKVMLKVVYSFNRWRVGQFDPYTFVHDIFSVAKPIISTQNIL